MNTGSFSGNPKTEWLSPVDRPDREMKLLEDFSYTDPSGRVWRAPAGKVVNGASIPRPLWSTVGSPYTDDYRNASVVHDIACEEGSGVPRREADKMFYYACLAGGCESAQARLLYAGVRLGAWAGGLGGRFVSSRRTLLYRKAGDAPPEARFLQMKFVQMADRLHKLEPAATFEAVESAVDAALDPAGGS